MGEGEAGVTPVSGLTARPVALWLGAVMALAVLALQVVPVLAPAIATATGLPATLLGAWSAGLWAAALLGTLAAPALLARIAPWRLSQASLLLCAAGVAAAATGHGAGLLAAALLIGLGHGLEAPAAAQLLAAHVTAPQRALWFSVKQTGVQLGAMAASLLLPALALRWGWRPAALTAAAMTLGLALLLQRPARGHAVPCAAPAGQRSSTWATLRRRPVLAWMALAAAAFGAMQVVLNGFFVSYAVGERGVTLVQAGAWLGAAQVGGLFGRVFWGWLAGRQMGQRQCPRMGRWMAIPPLLLGLGLTMAACSLLLGWRGPAWALMVAFGLSASGWNGIFLAEVARQVPTAEAGAATAAVLVVMIAGLVAGPLVFSALGGAISLGGAFMAWAGVALAGCAALLRAQAWARQVEQPSGRS